MTWLSVSRQKTVNEVLLQMGSKTDPLQYFSIWTAEAELLVAGNVTVHEAAFKVRAVAFPACDWYEFRKVFKPLRTNRTMRDPGGPPWERIDGRGFTIWVSDGCLSDSRTAPPTWEIRLESLIPLNPAGQQRWAEVCEAITLFIQSSGLEPVGVADAEPFSCPPGQVNTKD